MGSHNDYYMDPNYDPQKANMSRLREIFMLNDVPYTGTERKAELVKLFNLHIGPLIPELRQKEEKLKQKVEAQHRSNEKSIEAQHKSKEKKKRPSRSRSPEAHKTPGTPKTTGTGRGKKRNRGKVTDDDGNIPTTPTPLHDQVLEPLIESTPVAEVSRDDQIANDNQLSQVKYVSSEDKDQTHPTSDISFTDAPKLYSEILKSPRKEEPQSVRREARAYAYRNPNCIPHNQISLLSPDVDFSALEPSSSRGWLVIFTIFLFLVGTAFMMLRIRVEIGFCDSGDLLNSTVSDVSEIPEDDKKFIESNCTPCPPYGHCFGGKLVSCDEGYTISSSSLNFSRLFSSRCVVDLNRVQKIEKYTKILKDVVAIETGRMKCGAGGIELTYFESLKEKLRARKIVSQESAEDFEKYSRIALEKLRDDKDVEVGTENNGSEEHVCIISKKPKIGIFCRVKNNGIDFLRENVKMIVVYLIGFLIIIWVIFYIRRKKWEAYQVRKATDTVLNLMKQNREIVSEQWRESVMHQVTDDLTRIYLWKRVEERLQENPLVRTRRLDDYKGRRSLQWDWLGEKHAIY